MRGTGRRTRSRVGARPPRLSPADPRGDDGAGLRGRRHRQGPSPDGDPQPEATTRVWLAKRAHTGNTGARPTSARRRARRRIRARVPRSRRRAQPARPKAGRGARAPAPACRRATGHTQRRNPGRLRRARSRARRLPTGARRRARRCVDPPGGTLRRRVVSDVARRESDRIGARAARRARRRARARVWRRVWRWWRSSTCATTPPPGKPKWPSWSAGNTGCPTSVSSAGPSSGRQSRSPSGWRRTLRPGSEGFCLSPAYSDPLEQVHGLAEIRELLSKRVLVR